MVQIRMIDSSPALVVEGKKRCMVVSDVHIGYESRFAANDIHLGKYSGASSAAKRILGLMDESKSESLVLLGDVKSGTASITESEWRTVPEFFAGIGSTDTILVPGNHDGNISRLLPDSVTVSGQSGVVVDGVLLTHGHAMPSEKFGSVSGIVMGHVHPAYRRGDSILNGSPVWVNIKAKRECIFPSRGGTVNIIIMPPFNEHLHGQGGKRNAGITSPILKRALDGIVSASIVSMNGAILGDESDLEHVI